MLKIEPNHARVALAAIRLFNGAVGLLAPQMIIGKFTNKEAANPVGRYALRMFGVRTLLLGVDLLRPPGPERHRAVELAPIIHASDLVAALLTAISGKVSARTGVMIVGISALNTLLALNLSDEEQVEA